MTAQGAAGLPIGTVVLRLTNGSSQVQAMPAPKRFVLVGHVLAVQGKSKRVSLNGLCVGRAIVEGQSLRRLPCLISRTRPCFQRLQRQEEERARDLSSCLVRAATTFAHAARACKSCVFVAKQRDRPSSLFATRAPGGWLAH